MRNDEGEVQHSENQRAPDKTASRQNVRERRSAEDCPEGRRGRGDQRQRERFAQLLVTGKLPNAGDAARANETDERREEKEKEE